MKVNNKRKFLQQSNSELNLKKNLKENFSRFITEDEEEDEEFGMGGLDDEELGGEELDGEELDGEELDGEELDGEELDGEDSELTPTQSEQVEGWVDELLGFSIEDGEDDELGSLDLEGEDGIEPTRKLRGNLPLDADDMDSIIDNDNSLDTLQNELESISLESDEDEYDDDDELDELEESINILEADALNNVIRELEEGSLNEAVDILENVLFDRVISEAKDFSNQKRIAKKAPRNISIEDTDFDNESDFDNDKQVSKIAKENSSKLKDTKAVFENYKLTRVNGLLIVAGNKLSEKSRLALSEGFKKCRTKQEVEKIYAQVIERLKGAESKPNILKESHNKKINIIKESKVNSASLSKEQERMNYLMGIKGSKNMYGQNL